MRVGCEDRVGWVYGGVMNTSLAGEYLCECAAVVTYYPSIRGVTSHRIAFLFLLSIFSWVR
jgi:hypothetical protein